MCGIVYAHDTGRDKVSKAVLKRFKKQSHRGTEGFGFVAFHNGKLIKTMRAESEKEIEKAIREHDASHILFHHRFPTSTVNVKESAHPIRVSNPRLQYTYHVVHNGIISNAESLKKKHEALGYVYTTTIEKVTQWLTRKTTYQDSESEFNDSEAMAIDFCETIEGLQVKMEAKGPIAMIAIQTDKAGNVVNVFYGRNGGNPLGTEAHGTFFALRSEGGQNIETHTLYSMNPVTHETTEKPFQVGLWQYPAQVGKEYHMPTQKSVWDRAMDVEVEDAYPTLYTDDYPAVSALDYTPKEMIDDLGMSVGEVLDSMDLEMSILEEMLRDAVLRKAEEEAKELEDRLDTIDRRRMQVDMVYKDLLTG